MLKESMKTVAFQNVIRENLMRLRKFPYIFRNIKNFLRVIADLNADILGTPHGSYV